MDVAVVSEPAKLQAHYVSDYTVCEIRHMEGRYSEMVISSSA